MVYSTLQTPITGGAIRGCSAIQMPVKRPIMPDMAMAVRASPMWASSNPAKPVCPLGVQAQNPLQQFHEPLTGAGGALRLPDRPPRSGRTGGSAPS